MKRFALAFFLLSSSALADDKLPSKLDRADALELENIDMKLERLKEAWDKLSARKKALLGKYKIDEQELGHTVGINLETGEIQRAAPSKPDPKK